MSINYKDLSDEAITKVAELIGVEAAEELRCLKEMNRLADKEMIDRQARIDAFAKKFFIGAFVVVQKEFLINTIVYRPGAIGKVVGRNTEQCIIEFALSPYITINISSYFNTMDERFIVLMPTNQGKDGTADALCDS